MQHETKKLIREVVKRLTDQGKMLPVQIKECIDEVTGLTEEVRLHQMATFSLLGKLNKDGKEYKKVKRERYSEYKKIKASLEITTEVLHHFQYKNRQEEK